MASASISYVGHATVVIDMDGARILTDPLLRHRVVHLRRAAALDVRALLLPSVDAVLISHLHYDHLDIPSLRLLDRDTPIVCPRGSGQLVRRKTGAANVIETQVGDEVRFGGLAVRATPAEHDSSRSPWGPRAEPVGFAIEGSRSVYFAGDTDLFAGMREIGPVDVALLPIWGWGPSLGTGHLDPGGAAAALPLLRPGIAIPIHWGTYYPIQNGMRGIPGFIRTPAAAFERAAASTAPDVEVRVLRPGESTDIS